jgi:hypothetical protein
MKWAFGSLMLATSLAQAGVLPAVEDDKGEEEPTKAITYGGGLAGDVLHSSHDKAWLENMDLGLWMEADLGELIHADDCYLFVNPSLVWGAEESWKWKTRIYQAWMKWDGSEKFNVLAGMVDLSWHFHSLPSAAHFVRMPARSTGEFSPGSLGLLDLFPISNPTLRFEFKPTDKIYAQSAASWLTQDHEIKGRRLLQGLPAGERFVFINEVGYNNEGSEENGWQHRKLGLGGWWLPGAQRAWGAYGFGDAKLWGESVTSSQGLSGFLSASVSQAADVNLESRVVSGLSYEGLFPWRNEDCTAVAAIREELENGGRTAWELLHRWKFSDSTWMQFSLQWQSGLDDGKSQDWRAGLRAGFEF